MPSYIALLRAVNVGGTGKLPMAVLQALCAEAGFSGARTYIASGNALFTAEAPEAEVRRAIETRLEAHAGKPVGVIVRTAEEMAGVVARNPFAMHPGNRVAALFCDAPLPETPLEGASGRKTEQIALGEREIFLFYPDGQADTRLRLPAMAIGTARNMNTVAKLAEMARAGG